MKTELKGLRERSEEVEMLMGQTPNWIFRWGITLIAIIVAALLTAAWFIPWPETTVMHGKLEVLGKDTTWFFRKRVTVDQLKILKPAMEAHITLDVKDDSWGYYSGTLEELPLRPDSTGLYPVVFRVGDCRSSEGRHEDEMWSISRRKGPWLMDASATVILHKRRLLRRLVERRR